MGGQNYLACVRDKSWKVRSVVAKSIKDGSSPNKETDLEQARQSFKELFGDNEPEVHLEAAKEFAKVANVLGADYAKEYLVPDLKMLVMDENIATRVDLSTTLMEMVGPLGPQKA